MNKFKSIYKEIYKNNNLFNIDKKIINPFKTKRVNSVAIIGGILGDEGKGRITDELTADFLKKYKKVIHYRDNGGANAGHTVIIKNIKIALHQLGSGITQKGCTVILGKEMVLHPEDLVEEIKEVKKAFGFSKIPSKLLIDEMAFLSLDTHRAFESILKNKSTGSKGATGRGISPAYADIIYRHPLRIRDLFSKNWKEKVGKHYNLYKDWIKGMGDNIKEIDTARLSGKSIKVGSESQFLDRLEKAKKIIKPFVSSVNQTLEKNWHSQTPMVFEKAQALGLDKRWGVYPDITASDCTFDGIFSSTEGIVDPQNIAVKAATLKTTYSSSVGSRILPTLIKTNLAEKIRKGANEYGATTKRPRDIAYIDLPMISYLFKVGRVEYLTLTHLDICYLDTPIKVCINYKIDGKSVSYRPDQEFLNKVKPEYIKLPSWETKNLTKIKKIKDLPWQAQKYIAFLNKCLGTKLFMLTTGPKRNQTIKNY